MAGKKKKTCSKCRKPGRLAESVREVPAEAAEPCTPAYEEVKDPDPFPEDACEAVEPAAAEDLEIAHPACEEIEDPKPVAEDACEAIGPTVAEEPDGTKMPTAGSLFICEYDQPKSRSVTQPIH